MMPDVDGFTLATRIAADPRLAATKVILLTSAGLGRAPAASTAARFDAQLSKPVKQSNLLDTIVTLFASPGSDAASAGSEPGRRRRPRARALRVLVAEDNLTNQKLLLALLSQNGHRVTVVGNGRDAVATSGTQRFDLILMDVQMPQMGGLEAATAIRARERDTGGHVPIIALTAHAMSGDRERCLAAGMDAYVAKPLRPDELFSAIDRLRKRRLSGAAHVAVPESSPGPAVDRAALLTAFGGQATLLADAAGVFLTDAPQMLGRLRAAAEAGDLNEIAAAAHALKGAAGLFSEGDAFTSARALEVKASAGEREAIDGACAEVEQAMAVLMEELRALIQQT
jgi:two-component system sensor histidine kinase/response regulator